MNLKEWLIREMTAGEAMEILGIGPGDDVKDAYRRASMRNHPDRGGSEESMKAVNRAFEILQKGPEPKPKTKTKATPRETYNNLDYCLYVIEEESKKKGPTNPYTFWAWDGVYFRGVFTANTNPESFPMAAKIMEIWDGRFYDTKAVFVEIGNKELLLLRHNRTDVSDKKRTFTHESFNRNPGNDREFVDELRRSL